MGLLKSLFVLASTGAAMVVGAGMARTLQTRRSPEQREFLSGRVPRELPDGFYEGSADFDTHSWKGKTFNAAESRGANVLENDGARREEFPFRLSTGPGLQDPAIEVLKIDYDLPDNPCWLRFILDEVVEVDDGKLLGKIHLRVVPGLPFSVGYFRLEKVPVPAAA